MCGEKNLISSGRGWVYFGVQTKQNASSGFFLMSKQRLLEEDTYKQLNDFFYTVIA